MGYARAPMDEEALRLQNRSLRAEGCDRILAEAPAAVGDRAGFDAVVAEMRPGDTLVVCRLEVIARSLDELVDRTEALRSRGIGLRSLAERIDTDAGHGRFVQDLFGVLAAFRRTVERRGVRPSHVAARPPFPSRSARHAAPLS